MNRYIKILLGIVIILLVTNSNVLPQEINSFGLEGKAVNDIKF